MPPTPALQKALNDSITSGCFADTKIYLFSHRDSTGSVRKPKALYANSAVLKSVPYFNDLFSGNYSETTTKDLERDTTLEDEIAKHYDYDSDSDLEDAEDSTAPGLLLCFRVPPAGWFPRWKPSLSSDEDHVFAHYEDRVKEGTVIKVQDVAFITFQAFLLYLYTGHIEFAPSGSKANRRTRATEITSLAPDRVPRPSPKSIYRLADKYDVPALKSIALEKIKEGLGKCDAVRESFSRFTSHYPEILRMHIENLASVLTEVKSEEMQSRLDERLLAFTTGEIDHASEAFLSLWKSLARRESNETIRDTRSNAPGHPPSAGSQPLNKALIKSIRQGLFCDRRYSAKLEDTGKWRAPVYVSSIVLGDAVRGLNFLIEDPKDSGTKDLDDGCDSDSDYEDVADGGTPDWEVPKSGVGAALSTGALLTWRNLFFFLYADRIEFAPLKSQGLKERMRYVRENSKPDDPPLCSPKSICYLAGKLGLSDLEATALGDALAKTSATNLIRETFSKSTARTPRICKAQCKLLLSLSKNDEIASATEKHIRDLAGSGELHRYAALRVGFRTAIEAKRGNPDTDTTERPFPARPATTPFPAGPTLQCSNKACSGRNMPLLMKEIGWVTTCRVCGSGLECHVCGRSRQLDWMGCPDCGREWN